MTDKNNNATESMNRRSYLRAAVAGGTVPFLTESAVADDLSDYGAVNFVEVGFAYDVDDDDVGGALPTAHVDQLLFHSLGPQDEVLYLNETFLETPVSPFESQRAIAYVDGFEPVPVRRSRSPRRVVTTGLGQSYRKTAALELSELLEPNPVAINIKGQTVSVSTPSAGVEVIPGDEIAHEMTPRSASVTVSTFPDETAPTNSREPVLPTKSEEEVTITPRVHVSNYGTVDVVGVEAPVPETTLGP